MATYAITDYEYRYRPEGEVFTDWEPVPGYIIQVGDIAIAPGNLEVRVKATGKRKAGPILSNALPFTVAVGGTPPVTPPAPTVTADDTANTLYFSHALGTSEILVSINDGEYGPYSGPYSIGNVDLPAGYYKAKVKEAQGRNESAVASSPVFTLANTTPAAPAVIADDSADTLSFSHALGDSEIVVSINNAAYAAYAGPYVIGDVARAAGYYKAKIKAATGRNESAVTESPAFTVANVAPVANAGTDNVITLPTSSFVLQGSGTDSDGTIASYLWEQLIGPNTATLSSSAEASPTVTNYIEGTYQFRLTVTDNSGATHQDTVQITINPAPNPTLDVSNATASPYSSTEIKLSYTNPTETGMLRIYVRLSSGTDADYELFREIPSAVANEDRVIIVNSLLNNTAYTFRITRVIDDSETPGVIVSATTMDVQVLTYNLKASFDAANQSIGSGTMTTSKGVEIGELTAYIQDGAFNIYNNRLTFAGQATPDWSEQWIVSRPFYALNAFGQFMRFKITKSSTGTTKMLIGASNNHPIIGMAQNINNRLLGLELHANNTLYVDNQNIANAIGTYTYGSEYEVAIVAGGYDREGTPYSGSGPTADFDGGLSLFIRGGTQFPEWTMLSKTWVGKKTSMVLGQDWTDFSDGGNATTNVGGALYLRDANSTFNTQTKVRASSLLFAPKMYISFGVTFEDLNDSFNMDNLTPEIPGYGTTNLTSDDNINKSGLSFAIVHPSMPIRAIWSITKAQDYDITGNLEVWVVEDGDEAGWVVFRREWIGNTIPIGTRFQIDSEYNLVTESEYEVTLKANGVTLLNKIRMGMQSVYAGNQSMLFQCKGTAEYPVAYKIHDFRYGGVGASFAFNNYDAVGALDSLEIRNLIDDAIQVTDHALTPAAGVEITHDANGVVELFVKTLPTAGNIEVGFRYQDASNYYRLLLASSGNLVLRSVSGGVVSGDLLYFMGVLKAEDKIRLITRGSKLELWRNGKLDGSYNTLTLFSAATVARVISVGTGGALYSLSSQPLVNQSIIDALSV